MISSNKLADRSIDTALDRAEACLEQINTLLATDSPLLHEVLPYDLKEDLLLVRPDRQSRRPCCSL